MMQSFEPYELAKKSGLAYRLAEYAERQLASFRASARAFADSAIQHLIHFEQSGYPRKQYSTTMLPSILLKNSFEFQYMGVTILYSMLSATLVSIDHVGFEFPPPGGTPVSAQPLEGLCRETLDTFAVSTTRLQKDDLDGREQDNIYLNTGRKMRVLMVEDDVLCNWALINSLRDTGAMVEQVESGEEALEMLRHYDFDIVMLELTLVDMEGYEVVRRMRAARMDTSVLMLSALMRPQARVRAFAIGADDFIIKPYDVSECVARIQAVVRRTKEFSQSVLQVGLLQLSLKSRSVTFAERPVHLTSKEYAILSLLVMRKGMVLTKEVFLTHLYGGMDEPEIKVIDVFIYKLRKKLAEAGARNVIGTVRGRGYTVRDTMPVRAAALNAKLQWKQPQAVAQMAM